jgi:hypothetical protein
VSDIWSNATRTLTAISDSSGITTLLGRIAGNIRTSADDVSAETAQTAAVRSGLALEATLTDIKGAGFATGTDSLKELRDAVDGIDAGGAGAGARTVTITVLVSSLPVQNARVRLTMDLASYVASTNSSGQAVLNVDDGTYTVAISKPSYSFAGASLSVAANVSQSYTVTANSPSNPGPAGTCLVTFGVVDEFGDPVQGAEVMAELNGTQQASGSLIVSTDRKKYTDTEGLARLVLIQGGEFTTGDGIYDITIKTRNRTIKARYQAPDTSTAIADLD